MLKVIVLSGATLLASAGISAGGHGAPSPAGLRFALSPASSAEEVPEPARASHRSVRERDGLFYISAVVNGVPVRFVVDTGSNIVVLTKRDAARVGMTPTTGTAVAIQTVGGAARMHSAKVDRINVAGQSLEDVDAAIVEDGLDVSLLGQSALSRLDSIRFEGDRLELN